MDKVYIINESASQSIVSDILTYGGLFGGFFINRYFLGDSIFIQIFIALLFLIGAFGRVKHIQMSVDEARKYFSADQKAEQE